MLNEQGNIAEKEVNLLELVLVLAKRKGLIIKICAAAAVLSLGYSLTLPNIYSATAKVLPPQKEMGSGVSALLGQAGGLAGLASGLVGGGDLYLGIAKSRSVEDAVIRRLDLAKVYRSKTLESTRQNLDAAVKVQMGKDGIMMVTVEDQDPKRAALLANTIVEELGKTTVRLNLTKAGAERSFLEKRLDYVKKDLNAAEDDLKLFSQRNKIVQVESQSQASISGISRLKGELSNKEVQLSTLRTTRTEQSPEVKALEVGIRQLKGEISRLSGNSSDGEGIPSVGAVPSVGLEYKRKLREVKTQEGIFDQLTKQYEMAKLSEAKDSSSLQVLDEAVASEKSVKPKRPMIVVLATAAAFLVSIFVVFAVEHFERISDEDRKVFGGIKQAFRGK